MIKRGHVIAWEKKHRPLHFGDVALFYSGYTDKYYKPFPAGRRFLADPVDGKAPAWPDPEPDCMEYLASRKINVWSGHNYAWELASVLGIRDSGSAVRAGLVHYNDESDVLRLLEAVPELRG